MTKTIFWIWLLGLWSMGSLRSQFNFSNTNNNAEKNVLLKLNNQQRDSLKYVEEGLVILNTETNCLNYFSQKKWYALCGNCIPEPPIPAIDSVIQTGDRLSVFFNDSQVKADSFQVTMQPMNWSFSVKKSPFSIQLKLPATNVKFQIQAYNICGLGASSLPVQHSFKPSDPCRGLSALTDARNNVTYPLIQISNQCWLKGELMLDLAKTKDYQKEEKNYFYAWRGQLENSKNICPVGFRLPNKNDLNLMAEWVDEPFNNYTVNETIDQNLKELGVDFTGVRDAEGKSYFVNSTDYFWLANAYENQQGVGMISKSGIQEGAAPKTSFIPVRCIRDDSR